jgi:hypothetical protein
MCIDKNIYQIYFNKFDFHGSVHRRLLGRNTNNMQLCNRIVIEFVCPLGLDNGRSPYGHINQRLANTFAKAECALSAHSALATAGHHMGI